MLKSDYFIIILGNFVAIYKPLKHQTYGEKEERLWRRHKEVTLTQI